jgi:hypothetical protein
MISLVSQCISASPSIHLKPASQIQPFVLEQLFYKCIISSETQNTD